MPVPMRMTVLPFVGRVGGGGDAWGEVVVIGEVCLPVEAEACGELGLRIQLDLVLKEGAYLVSPVDGASDACLLRGEDVGRAEGVAGEVCEFEGAEAVGVIVDGAFAELQELETEADVVIAVAPADGVDEVDGVLGAVAVGLGAAANRRKAPLTWMDWALVTAWTTSSSFSRVISELVDEVGRDDDAVVEDGIVFA